MRSEAIKRTPEEKQILLDALDKIEASPELSNKLREKYGTDFNMARCAVNVDLFKKSAENFILSLVKE